MAPRWPATLRTCFPSIPCIVIQCDSCTLHITSLPNTDGSHWHKPSLWRVLASLYGTMGPIPWRNFWVRLDIVGNGHIWCISEDLFQVYQGNANCCARNHRSADGHHLECDKHRVATTLVGLYGMMLVQGKRLRGSSLYNEDRAKAKLIGT